MQILLTKLTDERHRLTIERDGGAPESVELETRSFLLHDLVHYAVEAEAPIEDGVWGLLAGGTTLAGLNERPTSAAPPGAVEGSPMLDGPGALSPGIGLAETLTAPMQSVWNGRLSVERYLELAPKGRGVTVDAGFVERVLARLRKLFGAWSATPFRGALVLDWPPRGEPRVSPPL